MSPVTFLTGASSGIGAALAPLFVAEGHAVAIVARRAAELETLADGIRAEGGQVLVLPCDVSDRDAVHAAVRRCEETLGPIDRLVANAGVSRPTPGLRFDALRFEEILRINLFGPAYCIEAVLPGMIARRSGHVVCVSSIAAFAGLPNHGAYCASKSGLNALLDTLRIDLHGTDVDLTTICPGFMDTPMTAGAKHLMPQLLEVGDAARRIHGAIRRRARMFAFPAPLSTAARLSQLVPGAAYEWVLARFAAGTADRK